MRSPLASRKKCLKKLARGCHNWNSVNIRQGPANFSCKGPYSKYFSLVGQKVSVATAQFCPCSTKVAMGNTQWGCVPMTLYLWKTGTRLNLASIPLFAHPWCRRKILGRQLAGFPIPPVWFFSFFFFQENAKFISTLHNRCLFLISKKHFVAICNH